MGKEAFDEMSLLIIQKAVPILEQMKAENKNVKFKNGPKNNSGNKDKNTINAESKDADNSEKNDDTPVGNNEINTEKTIAEIITENTAEYSSSTAVPG